MSDEASGHQMRFPPDYVPFLDVPKWISHRFGAQLPDGWDQELFSQIRTSTVGYRVRGITADTGLNMRMAPPGPNRLNAPWLILARSGEVIVDSWDEADFDPTNFTVAGPRLLDGSQARHPIEVRWIDVERWARSLPPPRANTAKREPVPEQFDGAANPTIPSQISELSQVPDELLGDPLAVAAFVAMREFAEDHVKTKGKPPKRDDAARAANKKVTNYQIYKARDLYRHLPEHLRNRARKPRT